AFPRSTTSGRSRARSAALFPRASVARSVERAPPRVARYAPQFRRRRACPRIPECVGGGSPRTAFRVCPVERCRERLDVREQRFGDPSDRVVGPFRTLVFEFEHVDDAPERLRACFQTDDVVLKRRLVDRRTCRRAHRAPPVNLNASPSCMPTTRPSRYPTSP